MQRPFAAAFALAAFALLSACASLGGGDATTSAWRKLSQVEQRFAVFINEPGVKPEGNLVTFRLVYVYMPGEVQFEGKEVAWQEYAAMTVNCVTEQVRTGPRTRYAPDGAVLGSDDSQEFTDINFGTAADNAALARCDGEYKAGDFSLKNNGKWMDAARKHIAATPPPVED